MVDAGYTLRKLSPRQLRAGRTGRGVNPPPQFGHTFSSSSTHAEQNVHSKLQIIAFAASGGSAVADRAKLEHVSSSVARSDDAPSGIRTRATALKGL